MLLYLINNTVDMLRRGQVAPYASAAVEALRPAQKFHEQNDNFISENRKIY